MMRSATPHLAYCDVTHRGYGALKFAREACEAEWVAFDDVSAREVSAPTVTRMSAAASSNAGPGAWAVDRPG